MLCLYITLIFWAEPYQVAKESVTESMGQAVDKKDVSVQFNYIIPSKGTNSIIHLIYICVF